MDRLPTHTNGEPSHLHRHLQRPHPPHAHARPPRLGLLSKRVFHSPVVKFILQARIRSAIRQDFVFVGSHYLQVREVENGANGSRTRHVALKHDFDARIRNARVISTRLSAPSPADPPKVKREGDPADAPKIKREDEDDHGPPGPPQMVLLTLDSLEVVLLAMKQDGEGRWVFVTSKLTLPSLAAPDDDPVDVRLRVPGDHLAVDPGARAFAVAGLRDTLIIYKIRRFDSVQASLNDIVESSVCRRLSHTILQMEFLCAPKDQPDLVQLVLTTVTAPDATNFELILFRWNAGESFNESTPLFFPAKMNRGELNSEIRRTTLILVDHGFPCLLIPSQKFPSHFLVARESAIYLCEAEDNGNIAIRHDETLQAIDPISSDPACTVRRPLWVSWGLAWSWKKDEEFTYLAREDGWICYRMLRREPRRSSVMISQGGLGDHLSSSLGTAFTVTDEANNYDQFRSFNSIVFVGELCDGGLYTVGDTRSHPDGTEPDRVHIMTPNKKETFYNWAPFLDLIVVASSDTGRSNYSVNVNGTAELVRRPNTRPALLATTGKNQSGSISEIRFGCEMPVRDQMNLEKTCKGANEVWALNLSFGKANFFVLSAPYKTFLLSIEGSVDPKPIYDEPTVAAAVLPPTLSATFVLGSEDPMDVAIMLTRNGVRLEVIDTSVQHETIVSPIENLTLGAIDVKHSLILCTVRRDGSDLIMLKKYDIAQRNLATIDVGEGHQLSEDATDIIFLTTRSNADLPHDGNFAAFSDVKGNVHFMHASESSGLNVMLSYKIDDAESDTEYEPINNIVWLPLASTSTSDFDGILLCGMRSGKVVAVNVRMHIGDNTVEVFGSISRQICHSPVRAVADLHQSGCAFVFGGPEVCYVAFTVGNTLEVQVQNIYILNREDRSWSNGEVFSACQAPLGSRLSGDLVCLTKDELLTGPFDSYPQPLPRSFAVKGTPTRLLHSAHLQAILVATTSLTTVREEMKRYAISQLRVFFLPPGTFSTSQIDFSTANLPQATFSCPPGERICSMTEWFCSSNGDNRHHFVVVATETTNHKGDVAGRLHLLKPSRTAATVAESKSYDEEDAIWAICSYGDRSLIYCSGKSIIQRTYSADGGRFQRQPIYKLQSPGIYISVNEPFVYVTTAEHSVMTLRYAEDHLELFAADNEARVGISHMMLPEHNMVLTTTKQSQVVGVILPPSRTQQLASKYVLAADLPVPITRLVRANVRPLWKRDRVPGVVERDILGTSSDGSLFCFSLISEASWRLLRFIQNMCARNDDLCNVSARMDITAPGHIEPSDSEASDWHVDGDLLSRLLERHDAEEILDAMLDAPCTSDDDFSDFDSPAQRRQRFLQLAHHAIGCGSIEDSEVPSQMTMLQLQDDGQGYTEKVLSYIRAVLDIPF